MRISDWSSDVCSSDLRHEEAQEDGRDEGADGPDGKDAGRRWRPCRNDGRRRWGRPARSSRRGRSGRLAAGLRQVSEAIVFLKVTGRKSEECQFQSVWRAVAPRSVPITARSEEHTSELQSLMRISYAVFCLKKKKIKTNTQHRMNKSTT